MSDDEVKISEHKKNLAKIIRIFHLKIREDMDKPRVDGDEDLCKVIKKCVIQELGLTSKQITDILQDELKNLEQISDALKNNE